MLLDLISAGILILNNQNNPMYYNKTFATIAGITGTQEPDVLAQNNMVQNIINLVITYKTQGLSSFEFFIEDTPCSPCKFRGSFAKDATIIITEQSSPTDEVESRSIQAILDGQENERRRIGREIHDGLGPLMSFIKLSLDSVLDDKKSELTDSQTEQLQNISKTIDMVSSDLRSLSHKLVPRTLDEFGLQAAFTNLASKLNESKKVEVEFYTNLSSNTRFDNEIELNIFRCGQELLSNSLKHARASHILVQIILHKNSIVLMVEDDGTGFDQSESTKENQGIGLTNVATRVKLLNGVFSLDSVINKGTVASIEIPV
ncbi:sensor histidine kinase [Plebeiibacterium marinum]|uniref:Oxygen sensor histidine kinase NreB n=1 Tax=Plebeiibacterium marinum TaxID=2992111 RepID=A0AAE3MIW9_9BACT|nr:sensor histidine kinase [Plebeiobacterium marinum]MCW3807902.1 sensor histidine kinase [Plebeiobacterium marinum]